MDRGLLAPPPMRTGPPRLAAIVGALCALIAAGLLMLPWHTARHTRAFEPVRCLAIHGDCKAAEPQTFEDTGFDHAGPLPLVLLAFAALALVAINGTDSRRIWLAGGIAAAALLGAAGVDALAATLVSHAFNDIRVGAALPLFQLLVASGVCLSLIAAARSGRVVLVVPPPAPLPVARAKPRDRSAPRVRAR